MKIKQEKRGGGLQSNPFFQPSNHAVSSTQEIYNGTVGGMPVKIVIKEMNKQNIMSLTQFRKLREHKHIFYTSEKLPLKSDDIDFCAVFTSPLKINNFSERSTFFVKEDGDEIVTIKKATAEKLGLLRN